MLTVLLWPRKGGLAETDLLGRAVWERTLDVTSSLSPHRTLWILSDIAAPSANGIPIEGIRPDALRRALKLTRGTVVVLAAELPCLTRATLKRLLSRARRGPSGLYRSNRQAPLALSGDATSLRNALSVRPAPKSLEELAKRLDPSVVFPANDEELLSVHSSGQWREAVTVLRRRKVDALVSKGVLFTDPDAVHIDPDVVVGRGTRIQPWVVLEGATRIGRNCVVGSFNHFTDCIIGSGTIVRDHCFIQDSRIGSRVQIGPFAHLRPETEVASDAKVGNFVELKKTRVGQGSKVPHLSYLGDAEIGKSANVGAGTITCNYDGKKKHRTVVGDGAFIGSDVQLVAPIRVGKGAYVAAGSCIVEDVPAHSLAIARSRQVVKPNWARRRRT